MYFESQTFKHQDLMVYYVTHIKHHLPTIIEFYSKFGGCSPEKPVHHGAPITFKHWVALLLNSMETVRRQNNKQ